VTFINILSKLSKQHLYNTKKILSLSLSISNMTSVNSCKALKSWISEFLFFIVREGRGACQGEILTITQINAPSDIKNIWGELMTERVTFIL